MAERRQRADQLGDRFQAGEFQLGIDRRQVRERTWRPIRRAGCPTEWPLDPGADGWRSGAAARPTRSRCHRGRSDGIFASLILRSLPSLVFGVNFSESMTQSPSAAPLVMALNAGTPNLSRMIFTPTALSVAGPVTTDGSMPNCSRSSFTPPQAATGSFADSTTEVSAAANIRRRQDRFDAIGTEDAVAQLEHDHIRLALRHFSQQRARDRRAGLRGGGDHTEIGEDHAPCSRRHLPSRECHDAAIHQSP